MLFEEANRWNREAGNWKQSELYVVKKMLDAYTGLFSN